MTASVIIASFEAIQVERIGDCKYPVQVEIAGMSFHTKLSKNKPLKMFKKVLKNYTW